MNRHVGPLIAWLGVVSFSIHTAFAAIRTPDYNWDIIAYLAAVFYLDTNSEVETHRLTMATIQPLPNYPVLCNAQSYYTTTICTDAFALRAQLNFYLVRPLYLTVVYALYKLRVDPLFALVAVSAVSGFVLSIATAYWVTVKIGWIGLGIVPLVLLLSGIREVSQLQTPDALSAVVVFFSALLCLGGSWRAGLWVLVSALLIRPDTILFLFLLVVYRFVCYERNTNEVLFLAAIAVTAIALYGVVHYFAGHYGWGITLKHTVEPLPYPDKEMTTSMSLSEYLSILIFATDLQFFSHPTDIKTLYALIVGIVSAWLFEAEVLYRDFSLLCVVYIVLHYLIFPAFFTRFFVTHNMLIYLICMYSLTSYPPAIRKWRTGA